MRYELNMSKLLVKRSALVLPPHLVNLNKQSDRLESSSFPHCQATHFWNGSRLLLDITYFLEYSSR